MQGRATARTDTRGLSSQDSTKARGAGSLPLKVSMTKEPVALAALSDIYEHRYARFLRVAEAIVGDAEVARDVVQEAFVRLIRSRLQFRGEGSVDGWIWRTVVNRPATYAATLQRTGATIRRSSRQRQTAT